MTSIKQVYQIWQKYKAKKISYFSEWIQKAFDSWDKPEFNKNKWKKNLSSKDRRYKYKIERSAVLIQFTWEIPIVLFGHKHNMNCAVTDFFLIQEKRKKERKEGNGKKKKRKL